MPKARAATPTRFRLDLKTTKAMMSSCTIMGVPRMTVVYTLQIPFRMPSRNPGRSSLCWSWKVRTMATSRPSTTPRIRASTATFRVLPTPSRYIFHRPS